jgi:hypothetical protein
VKLRAAIAALLWLAPCAQASDEPYGVLDFALGMSYSHLERELDLRDLNTALAQIKAGRLDLGKRGYGCVRRDDPFADIGCVSHDERLDAAATREIRLHFLLGRLQQFSLTAEVQQHDVVVAYLRKRYGEPSQLPATSPGTAPSLK